MAQIQTLNGLNEECKDLVQRYIFAVVRHLKNTARQDISRELEGLIVDMATERMDGEKIQRSDITEVLMELGAPERLALKYSDERTTSFIEGIYFIKYKQILRALLPFVACLYFCASIVFSFFDEVTVDGGFIFLVLLNSLVSVFQSVAVTFAVVTIIFSLLCRSGALENTFDETAVENLPNAIAEKNKIPFYEPILAICLTIVFVSILIFPQIKLIHTSEFGWISIFDSEFLYNYVPLIAIIAVIGVGRELFALIEGRYSMRLSVITAVVNMVSVILYGVILLNNKILNTELMDYININSESATRFLQASNNIMFAIVLIVCVLETASCYMKSRGDSEKSYKK